MKSSAQPPLPRVNVGCGMTPTPGWHNLDNSISVRIANHGSLVSFGRRIGLISAPRADFIRSVGLNNIQFGDVRKRLPFDDNSMEVVYSSHMFEHLDRAVAINFLRESRRMLVDGGILRIAVPDLARKARAYSESGDADVFVESLNMSHDSSSALRERVVDRVVGFRQHRWMYDATSLSHLLESNGFSSVMALKPGETMIDSPGQLDLAEREDESLYVEGRKS